jgi:hypothetical protein
LKQFRQWGSRTPGHPENFETPGVEVTTGLFSSLLGCELAVPLAVLYKTEKVWVSYMVAVQGLLVRVSPMPLGWHLLRSTWLPASTSLTVRSSTTTRDTSNNANVQRLTFSTVLLLVCVAQFFW